MIAGCYFAGSRGPWIASVMAAIIMYVLGSANTRKRLSWLIVATLIVLIMRPGVLATFEHMAVVTFDKDTLKGSSYEYRNELWRKAYSEVSKSTQRTIFGYGPGSSEVMDMSGKLSYSEYDNSFWSWDNQYACSLLETGFVGLISAIILYAAILIRLLAIYLKVEKSEKTLVAALIASIAVMIVMMMSVKIFAPQLYFIFWTLIAVALHITKTRDAIPQGV
jgi:O-antigen ligase